MLLTEPTSEVSQSSLHQRLSHLLNKTSQRCCHFALPCSSCVSESVRAFGLYPVADASVSSADTSSSFDSKLCYLWFPESNNLYLQPATSCSGFECTWPILGNINRLFICDNVYPRQPIKEIADSSYGGSYTCVCGAPLAYSQNMQTGTACSP